MASGITHVLLVGPDDAARRALRLLLDRSGAQVAAVEGVDAAEAHVAAGHACDVMLATAELAPRLTGVLPVIAIVAPRADRVAPPAPGADRVAPPAMIGDGPQMAALRQQIERIAAARSTVLVLGESGTGKELVARALHDASPRRDRRFVAVNCAAIPEALLEAELFGHRRGAFTDAVRDRAGLFEDADGGTLFLDEIGELPLALQAKLLRVLQDGELRRIGDNQPIHVDVRLIAATLRDLGEEVRAGRFREDLFYRLNVLPIHLPALRDRAEDIPALARFFAGRHARRHNLGEVEVTDDAAAVLAGQPWPGNVRELENAIERAVVLADGTADGRRVVDGGYLTTVLDLAP
ncbi:MAG TPA: sigma 54-interacting transcriptional regulator, partial [Kofleriaceae bacterium]